MPFYKRNGDTLLDAPNYVIGPGFELRAESQAENAYPVDGWYWFDTLDAALSGMKPANGTVTKRQAVKALILTGKDDALKAALASLPGTEGKLARAEWEETTVVERNHPLIAQMIGGLGWTAAEVDALFVLAATM